MAVFFRRSNNQSKIQRHSSCSWLWNDLSNNGAYWLSKQEKVINPYFGEAMLTCGEVKQVIE